MKLLCIKDVLTHDNKTGEFIEKSFTKDKIYKSRFFKSGQLLYAKSNSNDMHIVADGTDEDDTLCDYWFNEHFEIIDKYDKEW